MEYVAIIEGARPVWPPLSPQPAAGPRLLPRAEAEGPGTSILASGNGCCNLSNAHVDASLYRNAPFVARTFAACPPDCVRAFFADLGLAMAQEEGGRLYPTTNGARTVLRVLQLAASERGVRPVCHRMVKHVLPGGRDAARWQVAFMDGTSRTFDAVIVASGGLTPAPLLPDGFAFTRPVGRLCAIKPTWRQPRVWTRCGPAAPCRCGVRGQEAPVAQEDGEAQFRSFGLSGIAAFNLSRFAEPGMELRVDFLQYGHRTPLGGRPGCAGGAAALAHCGRPAGRSGAGPGSACGTASGGLPGDAA